MYQCKKACGWWGSDYIICCQKIVKTSTWSHIIYAGIVIRFSVRTFSTSVASHTLTQPFFSSIVIFWLTKTWFSEWVISSAWSSRLNMWQGCDKDGGSWTERIDNFKTGLWRTWWCGGNRMWRVPIPVPLQFHNRHVGIRSWECF